MSVTDEALLGDLAAELDDEDNDPTGDDAGADDAEPGRWYAGLVDDGPPPYNGKLIVSRFPKGVLLVSKPRQRAWVLDFDAAGGLYRCRDAAGSPLDFNGRWRAAEEPNYEVRAFDEDFDGDEFPTVEPDDAAGADYVEAGL